MLRRTPRSTPMSTRFPYPTLFRSLACSKVEQAEPQNRWVGADWMQVQVRNPPTAASFSLDGERELLGSDERVVRRSEDQIGVGRLAYGLGGSSYSKPALLVHVRLK